MRDKRFVAEHRGGTLTKEQHHQLMIWAIACVRHVLPLAVVEADQRLFNALNIAKAWTRGAASVGDARTAALDAIAVAKAHSDPAYVFVARAVGHAVATAHMADHALRAAQYAIKAVRCTGNSVESAQQWQEEQLPFQIKQLLLPGVE